MTSFPNLLSTEQDECLIVEELCRVIADAKRFQTCIEAWKAIQRTRKIAREIVEESTRAVLHPNAPAYDTETLRNCAREKGGECGP